MNRRPYRHLDPAQVAIEADPSTKVRSTIGVMWAGAVFLVTATFAATLWGVGMTNKVDRHSEQLVEISAKLTADHELLLSQKPLLQYIAEGRNGPIPKTSGPSFRLNP